MSRGSDEPVLTRRQLLIALGVTSVTGGAVGRILAESSRRDPAPGPVAEAPAGTDPPTPTDAGPSPTAPPTDETDEPVAAEPPEEGDAEGGAPYELVEGEVYTNAKSLAAAVAQGLTTYAPGEELGDIVARSLTAPAPTIDVAAIASIAAPLVVDGASSAGRVVYPQLGGLSPAEDPRTCSVMVVTEQRVTAAADEQVMTRTIDVRLLIVEGEWRLDTVASIGGDPLPRPEELLPEAEAVLADDRIDLPDSARWDIYAGIIDVRLLRAMLDMAERQPYAVTCLRNGHPVNVFGTDRLSNHTAGLGVDIWRVGPEAVVSQQPDEDTPAWQLNHELFVAGEVPELGGPWAFDGFGGRSFTNDVHLDHLHVAFYRGASS
jgi:hypothetical protein